MARRDASSCAGTMLEAFRDAAVESGIPQDRRLQPRRQRGRRALRGEPEARRALERVEGVPAPAMQPSQPHGADRGAREEAAARRPARDRRGVLAGRRRRRSPKRGARRYSPRARSAARRSCSSRASGRARCCRSTASRSRTTLPGVGDNLQDHLQLRMAFKVKNALTLNTMLALVGQGDDGARLRAASAPAR